MGIITDSHWIAILISILFYELFRELSAGKSNYFSNVIISVFFTLLHVLVIYFRRVSLH